METRVGYRSCDKCNGCWWRESGRCFKAEDGVGVEINEFMMSECDDFKSKRKIMPVVIFNALQYIAATLPPKKGDMNTSPRSES